MDFGALPPEVNSAKMYAGPGAGPMLAAAAAWESLSASVSETAIQTAAQITGIGDTWLGASALAMAAAGAQHVAWLSAAAARCQHTARQAGAAAAAYETAYAATVPPPVITANRAQLVALVASNVFGQNSPAIAATETRYGEMWAQDAEAMLSYAAASARATTLPTLTSPTGFLGTGSTLPELVNQYLQSFLSSGPYEIPLSLLQVFSGLWTASSIGSSAFARASAVDNVVTPALREMASPGGTLSISARIGGAGGTLGPLSVPPSWGVPPVVPGFRALPATGAATAGEDGGVFGLPMGAAGGSQERGRSRPEPEYGFKSIFTAIKGI